MNKIKRIGLSDWLFIYLVCVTRENDITHYYFVYPYRSTGKRLSRLLPKLQWKHNFTLAIVQ